MHSIPPYSVLYYAYFPWPYNSVLPSQKKTSIYYVGPAIIVKAFFILAIRSNGILQRRLNTFDAVVKWGIRRLYYGRKCDLPGMFFPKRSLPVLQARLSPHDQTPGHNNSQFCKDRTPRSSSCVDISTEKLGLARARQSMPVAHAVPSQNAASVICVVGNTPRSMKLFSIQCESGTLIQPLKAHVWSQRRHITNHGSNTAQNSRKDGRDRSIHVQALSRRIIFQKHILGSRLSWWTRDLSTNVVG